MNADLTIQQKLFIGGQWQEGSGPLLGSENPCTGDEIWAAQTANADEVSTAVSAARAAFAGWSTLALEARIECIRAYVQVLETHRQALAQAIHLETGKPLWESLTEVGAMIGKLAISERAQAERAGFSESQNGGVQAQLIHKPLGVFAVLGPFNFPGHLPNGHIIPALLAGNTLVFKPSELTPMVGELMVRCWELAGLPPGVLNLVQGSADTGAQLVAADIDGLLFTGSANTGKALHRQFAGQPHKMLALEMGGNNPLVIAETESVDAAVYLILQSAFISAGQRCTCARRLILIESDSNRRILQRLIEVSERIRVGGGDGCFMGPVINNRACEHLLNRQQQLLDKGAETLLPMRRMELERPFLAPGIVDCTTVIDADDEESFGPLLQVYWAADFERALDLANATRFGLSAGLVSDSVELWQRFLNGSRAGIVNWNRPLTGASSAAPFGGIGDSGNFRSSAYYAADYCAFPVASLLGDSLQMPETLSPGISL